MPVLILHLLSLIVSAQAIRIDRDGNAVAANEICNDPVVDPLVTPLLRELQSFYQENGYTAYPGAISAVGALRYGGNSVVVGNTRHQIDHDVDLLVGGQNDQILTMADTFGLLWKLATHMSNKGYKIKGLAQSTLADWTEFAAFMARWMKKDFKDKDGNSYVMCGMNFVEPENPLQERFMATELDRAVENMKEMSGETKGEDKDHWKNIKSLWKNMKDLTDPMFAKKNLEAKGGLHIDNVFRIGPQTDLQPHASRKFMFHGTEFKRPADMGILDNHLEMAFWYKRSGAGVQARTKGLCAFQSPGDLSGFEDDMPNTPENLQVVQRCSMALQAHGYESYRTMCQNARPVSFFERIKALVVV